MKDESGGFHNVVVEDSSLLWCYGVCTGKHLSTFRRIVAPSSSGSNSSTRSTITMKRRYLLQSRQNVSEQEMWIFQSMKDKILSCHSLTI